MGTPFRPRDFTDEMLSALQGTPEDYDLFIASLADARGVSSREGKKLLRELKLGLTLDRKTLEAVAKAWKRLSSVAAGDAFNVNPDDAALITRFFELVWGKPDQKVVNTIESDTYAALTVEVLSDMGFTTEQMEEFKTRLLGKMGETND